MNFPYSMRIGYKVILLACFITFLTIFLSCNHQKSFITQNSFYYWESRFHMDEKDVLYLQQLDVKKLYIKFFDVDFDEQPTPNGNIYFNTAIPLEFSIVPVAFITNKTIANIDSIGIEDLSQKIITRIHKDVLRTRISNRVTELQIDCDWTNTTRDKYFYLLSLIKKCTSYTLSATIRLHQYKYFKNNLPPIDKGLLMCYNVNDPTDFSVTNSLFDKEEIMKYIRNVNYPLPLDLAVPAFSWGVRFTRDKRFDGFTNSLSLKEVAADTLFSKSSRENVFICKSSAYVYGRYLSEGEMIRVEEANSSDVAEIVDYLKTHLNNEQASLILFHYDNLIKENADQQGIQNIFKAGH